MTEAPFRAGDVVLTSYGTGVIVKQKDDRYVVRLWRIPGKSMGSSALAVLQLSAMLKRLPVAPGMVTTYQETNESPSKRVLVHCYYTDRNEFIVSELMDAPRKPPDQSDGVTLPIRRSDSSSILSAAATSEFIQVAPDQLQPTSSAKFYPVMEALMMRGEQTAAMTSQILQNDTTKRVLDQTGKVIQEKTSQLTNGHAEAKFEDVASSIEKAAPRADQNMKQVLTMIKDEELTVLLENCKQRLEQLVQTDLPQATQKALEKTGIRVQTNTAASTFSESMVVSRKAALVALQDLLQKAQLEPADLQKIRGELAENFTNAFDSLTAAARSDRSLDIIFESVAEKTTEWRKATGRILQTRSASLFLEGAGRLQARAAAILRQHQLQWAGEVGSKLTKSFTEGDAALARLKSIELGDAVKTRLVEAIEVRSESLGGLDGIIAGALTTVRAKSEKSGDQIKSLLTNLQKTASVVTTDAHETLISVLSHQSRYRDIALLRIEHVLCDLESQFGDDLAPEDIAAVARGEGGTAKLFEPIARRAIKQIEQHLATAEAQVKDGTVLEVLKRIRKIMSGELTIAALTDDLVDILNDDSVVRVGETLLRHSEHALDAIEGVSGNKAVTDAIQIAEKAGITKDSVIQEVEKLDVTKLLDTAGNAVSDEKARKQLVSSATDVALDFLLRILPSMPVPPFEGVRDGVVYHISNLSMEGFKVRKEDIQIELAGIRATKKRRESAKPVAFTPHETTAAVAKKWGREITDDSERYLAPEIRQSQSIESTGSGNTTMEFEEVHETVKATELLIIDISHISAILDDAVWSFEQTYMPYLKGDGKANVRLSEGSIRLQFELRKRRKVQSEDDDTNGSDNVWEPVLCLHDRSCFIGDVELRMQGEGRLTWIVNKLAAIFKGPLRDYVVRTIVRVLSNRSGWILHRLNQVLSPYWDLILRTAKLGMDDLVEADDEVVITELAAKDHSIIELVWREQVPLGMNLLMNDESGLLKVVDFPRGSQARAVCEKKRLDPEMFKGATIIAVNGSEYDDQDDLFESLKDPARPKTVRFELAESEDKERLQRFVATSIEEEPVGGKAEASREFDTCTVEFTEPGELGIEFADALDSFGLIVSGFLEGEDGIVLAAERSGKVRVGDLLTHINGKLVIGSGGNGKSRAFRILENAGEKRPLLLTFVEPYLYREVIEKPLEIPGVKVDGGPGELILSQQQLESGSRVTVEDFEPTAGMAESSGVLIGDQLVFVNGMPVGAGVRWLGESYQPSLEDVYCMLRDDAFYPIGLTFARPRKKESRWKSSFTADAPFSDAEAETISVAIDCKERVGCILDQTGNGEIVVTDFNAVPGIFQRALVKYEEDGKLRVSIDWLNGEFVPSYATKDMIRSALNRSWKADERIEIWLCDDERKAWVHALK